MTEFENKITIKNLPAMIRPRERLINSGPESLSDAELLALVLESGINGKNALQMAQEILSEFESLRKIAAKYPAELESIKGLGQAKAAKVLAAIEIGKRAYSGENIMGIKISSPDDAADFLLAELGFREQEIVKVVILNVKNIILKVVTVSTGGLNSTTISPRDVFRPALKENGAAIILAHNHPSGDLQPSKADNEFTDRVILAGKTLGLKLLDHIIIGQGNYISFKRIGHLF